MTLHLKKKGIRIKNIYLDIYLHTVKNSLLAKILSEKEILVRL